jgi:hypothetical protein
MLNDHILTNFPTNDIVACFQDKFFVFVCKTSLDLEKKKTFVFQFIKG